MVYIFHLVQVQNCSSFDLNGPNSQNINGKEADTAPTIEVIEKTQENGQPPNPRSVNQPEKMLDEGIRTFIAKHISGSKIVKFEKSHTCNTSNWKLSLLISAGKNPDFSRISWHYCNFKNGTNLTVALTDRRKEIIMGLKQRFRSLENFGWCNVRVHRLEQPTFPSKEVLRGTHTAVREYNRIENRVCWSTANNRMAHLGRQVNGLAVAMGLLLCEYCHAPTRIPRIQQAVSLYWWRSATLNYRCLLCCLGKIRFTYLWRTEFKISLRTE